MPFQVASLNPCPVCGAETALAEIEPHPLHVNFEIHGYLCDRCGPIKSLVVLRSPTRQIDDVSPTLRLSMPMIGGRMHKDAGNHRSTPNFSEGCGREVVPDRRRGKH